MLLAIHSLERFLCNIRFLLSVVEHLAPYIVLLFNVYISFFTCMPQNILFYSNIYGKVLKFPLSNLRCQGVDLIRH